MRLLLDTHIFLWCLNNDSKLSKKARSLIFESTETYVSSVSIWEASIKISLGKLEANIDSLAQAISESGFIELPFTVKHAANLQKLPKIHRDPFDRMMLAQAVTEPLKFLTADHLLKKYSDLIEVV